MEPTMKTSKRARLGLVIGLLAGLGLCCPLSARAEEALVVIVNSSNPVETLSLADLKKLFLSDKGRWDTGKSVATVMLGPGAPERVAFLKVVCHMSDGDFAKYFVQAAFTGKDVSPPKEVGSASAVKGAVGSSPGAIGFVKASELGAGDSTVKAVKVDGAAASDAGYKLKM
jgi:ABC-type phosphate transport system substrate-binding protein